MKVGGSDRGVAGLYGGIRGEKGRTTGVCGMSKMRIPR
jgi:hypothetical protein